MQILEEQGVVGGGGGLGVQMCEVWCVGVSVSLVHSRSGPLVLWVLSVCLCFFRNVCGRMYVYVCPMN